MNSKEENAKDICLDFVQEFGLCALYYCVQKRGDSSPISKYRGFGVYSMNKTVGGRKFFTTRASATS